MNIRWISVGCSTTRTWPWPHDYEVTIRTSVDLKLKYCRRLPRLPLLVHFMNATAPPKPAVVPAAPITNVEESRAQRLQRQQARFRDRGGQVILCLTVLTEGLNNLYFIQNICSDESKYFTRHSSRKSLTIEETASERVGVPNTSQVNW